jgi:AmmeMemoRadiSam system protein A
MFQLSESSQLYLLKLSRQSIQDFLQYGRKPDEIPSSEELLEKRGAFVTLHKNELLRGCIGYLTPLLPLYRTIIDCSVSAAVEDPRFPPLQLQELSKLEIEISLLSPPQDVNDILDIEIGTHGLIISCRGKRGLLLPQVPLRYGWSRERFLEETCRKAGLSVDEWQKGARVECFTALIFKERQTIADHGLRIEEY